MLSFLRSVATRTVGVVNRFDTVEESGQGSVPSPQLRNCRGCMSGEHGERFACLDRILTALKATWDGGRWVSQDSGGAGGVDHLLHRCQADGQVLRASQTPPVQNVARC